MSHPLPLPRVARQALATAPAPDERDVELQALLDRTNALLAEEQKLRRSAQAELVGMDSKLSAVVVRLKGGWAGSCRVVRG